MTLERDLERLGRADLELGDEVPTWSPNPMSREGDENEPVAEQAPRRRGRPPGTWKPGRQAVQAPARVATLKERAAALQASKLKNPPVQLEATAELELLRKVAAAAEVLWAVVPDETKQLQRAAWLELAPALRDWNRARQ